MKIESIDMKIHSPQGAIDEAKNRSDTFTNVFIAAFTKSGDLETFYNGTRANMALAALMMQDHALHFHMFNNLNEKEDK